MDTGQLEGQLITSVIVSNRRAMTTAACVSIDGGGKGFLAKVRADLFLCYFPVKCPSTQLVLFKLYQVKNLFIWTFSCNTKSLSHLIINQFR